MNFFINGLSLSIDSIVAIHRESHPRRMMTYNALLQYARDEGEAFRSKASYKRNMRTQLGHFQVLGL